MSDVNFKDSGFDGFAKLLEKYQISEEDAMQALEEIAEDFVNDVGKLPKPRSAIVTAGHTHLLDTMTFKRKSGEIEVGWGKYYGPMVERGTVKMHGTPHIKPTFEQNKEKYFKNINKKLFE